MLCPFELSLDLTNLSDVYIIICDYNYVFVKPTKINKRSTKNNHIKRFSILKLKE